MANANAIVDKMVGLGLRHGEKAGMAIASMIFFVCVGAAATKPTIDTTPDQVKKAAEQSETNLNRKEDRETIVKRLEEQDKITKTNFTETVEEQIKVSLVPDNYKPAREWVTPEPGAGLIRDTPKLVAVDEVYAYPGRGGLLVYALDENGERIPLKEGEETEKQKTQRLGNTRRPKASGGMGGGMGGAMGGQRKKKSRPQAEILREQEEERKLEAKKKELLLAGGGVEDTKETKSESEAAEPKGSYKEVTKGYRWVAITGTLDHAQMLANYRTALKNPAVAHPHYARLDLQRKTLQSDGTWSDWQKVNAKKNLAILDNVPELDDELAPESVLPENLVDRLPFLKSGLWEKVHIASLVPKEKVKAPEEKNPPAGMGGCGGWEPWVAWAGCVADGRHGRHASHGRSAECDDGQYDEGSRPHGMGGMERGGMGSMMGGMGGSTEAVGNFWKSEEKKIMIRALDFTVEPDETYQYRVAVVVFNPNYNREDISPGTDNKSKVLIGPWSKETEAVTMPPDVMPYAIGTLPNVSTETQVRFQVVRFHPSDGVTVPHNFEAEHRRADRRAADAGRTRLGWIGQEDRAHRFHDSPDRPGCLRRRLPAIARRVRRPSDRATRAGRLAAAGRHDRGPQPGR